MAIQPIKLKDKVFDIADEPFPRGAWWWWFWIFFFNNPKNPSRPKQLMILWSTKNVKEIFCNGKKLLINKLLNRKSIDGAVAAWYFDGEKMHHNYLLDKCKLKITNSSLISTSRTKTSFEAKGKKSIVKIGKDFEFVATDNHPHQIGQTSYSEKAYPLGMSWSGIALNHASLKGKAFGKKIKGTAYFQRIFVKAPAPPWYWGMFHFANGATLSYFNPYVSGLSLDKGIDFFDGENLHNFKDISIKRVNGELPAFIVSGKNDETSIKFTVNPYSHSSWTFTKKSLGIFPNRLVYNEYPAVISNLCLSTKSGKTMLKGEELGKSVGNAEHTTGFLF